jgi:perosamine synthetase
VSSAGAYVERFERALAKFCGVSDVVAVSTGTAALQVALVVSGVKFGDEIFMPSLTFVGTANAVVHAGAIPHFVDCDPINLGLDCRALSEYIDDIGEMKGGELYNRHTGRRISAVVPMHVFGHSVDMDPLLKIAGEKGLVVVEDAAEALGSKYQGSHCGSIGDAGILSFNGNKIITTGGGGAILTNKPNLACHARHLTTTAKLTHRWEFLHDEVGFNFRMPNINAALGCGQMACLADKLTKKRALAEKYICAFSSFDDVHVLREPQNCKSNYWLNALILDGDLEFSKDDLLNCFHERGILSRPLWTPMHELPMFSSNPRSNLQNTESVARRVINVPSSPQLMLS